MATAPTNLVAAADGSGILLTWTNGETYDTVEVWRDWGSGYFLAEELVGSPESKYIWEAPNDTRSSFKVRGWSDSYPPGDKYSDFTSDVSVGQFETECSDECAVTDAVTSVSAKVTDVTDICDVSDSVTSRATYVTTILDTCAVTDSITSTQTVRSLYTFYWGSSDGNVYVYDNGLLSDNGASILSSWTSKTVDFSELRPDLHDRWKTLYKVDLTYNDLTASTPVILGVSNDGGATFTSYSAQVGTGSLTVGQHTFWIVPMTGQYFVFRVEWPSPDKEFQLLGLDVQVEVMGEAVS